ncbi:MAG: DOMON-like domain-containing protein [Alphaproteobacteria bacterium]|nr:MAG: DOMON-like domain-containing protein [Alphaproteobacteria bacterium]
MHVDLICHPDTPARSVERIRATFAPSGYRPTMLEYRVFASGGLAVPTPGRVERSGELWKTTCFELFTREVPDDSYFEFNFSPSRAWAAYRFDSYRKGMRDLPLAPPKIDFWSDVTGCSLRVALDLIAPWTGPSRSGLSAVIEEVDGTKSYWALANPNPEKPDFHHPDCFAIELPPLV